MKNEEINKKNYSDPKSNKSYPFKGPIFKKFQGEKILKIKNKKFYNIVAHLKIRAGLNLFLEKSTVFRRKKVSKFFFFKI